MVPKHTKNTPSDDSTKCFLNNVNEGTPTSTDTESSNDSVSSGLAAQAMYALTRNQAMREDIVDDISQGMVEASNSDLIEAIRLCCEFWSNDPVVKQGLYMGPCRAGIVSWYTENENNNAIESGTNELLLPFFRDLCTSTELLLLNIDQVGSDEHREQVLRGRNAQNRPSVYQIEFKVNFGEHMDTKASDTETNGTKAG